MKRDLSSTYGPAKPTPIIDTYWRFAAERHQVFLRKAQGERFPWTDDPIIRRHKFTNAFRASDRVSQFLIKEVIYSGSQSSEEVFFRIILFKIFNKIDTWTLLCAAAADLGWSNYSFEHLNAVLTKAMARGSRIYSPAYIMPPPKLGYPRKHSNHLKLLETMMRDELPRRVVAARSLKEIFSLLRSYPGIGDFLAYQYTIDLNYSSLINHSEMEFVVPGPGARSGISKCFETTGGLTEAEIIALVTDAQESEFSRLDLSPVTLGSRRLQLIDCQNLFCEVDKYARVAHPDVNSNSGRTRIKQFYRPTAGRIDYWYPPKWGINDEIAHVFAPNS